MFMHPTYNIYGIHISMKAFWVPSNMDLKPIIKEEETDTKPDFGGRTGFIELEELIIKEENDESAAETVANETAVHNLDRFLCTPETFPIKQECTQSNSGDEDSENVESDQDTKQLNNACCGKKFTSYASMKIHLDEQCEKLPLKCKECGKRFKQACELTSHIASHTQKTLFMCEHCGKEFSLLRSYNYHVHLHLKDKNLACTYCEYRCYRNKYLENHMQSHVGRKWLQCELCERHFSNDGDLTKHMIMHYTHRDFPCDECSRCYTTDEDLNYHIHVCHKAGCFYECEMCDFKTRQIACHTMHVQYKHSADLYHEKCHLCKYSALNLAKHIRKRHDGICTIACDQCDRKFLAKSLMLSHKSRCHITKYECTKCLKFCGGKAALETHQRRFCPASKTGYSKESSKKNATIYTCNQCAYTSKKEINLNNHMTVEHGGVESFRCNICKEQFLTQYKVLRHKHQYHRENGSQCDKCKKFYKDEMGLLRHSRVCPILSNTSVDTITID